MPINNSTPFPTKGTRIDISKDGTTWISIPGTSDLSNAAGDAPTDTSEVFTGTASTVGSPSPDTFTIEIAHAAVGSDAYRMLRDAFVNEEQLWFRWQSGEEKQLVAQVSGAEIVVATDGSVTESGSGTHPNLNRKGVGAGAAFKIEGDEQGGVQQYRAIATMSVTGGSATAEDTTITENTRPTASTTAAEYSVVQPAFVQPAFLARVTSCPQPSAPVGGAWNMTVAGQADEPIEKMVFGSFA